MIHNIPQSVVVSVAPTTPAVSLDEMKEHLRVTDGEEDSYIQALVEAITTIVQDFQGRQYVTATRVWRLDDFPSRRSVSMDVPFPPLQSVSSITYTDNAGSSQTWSSSDYDVDANFQPGRIRSVFGETYPVTRDDLAAVVVTYVCGYGSTADVPQEKKALIKMWTAHLFESREPVVVGSTISKIPFALETLLWHDRIAVPI